MAGVLVDVLLERLATLALDKIERELKLVVGVKQEIQSLTLKLEAIRAVLEDAEQRQEMEASVKLWLDKLNDVSYDMDDVLDEWITRVLVHQMEKQENGTENATAKKKVCLPFPSSCFRFGQVDYKPFLRHEVAKKIEELNERLASIDERKQSFSLQITRRAEPELPQRQKTTSLPNVKTFGRDNEKNLIISKLLSESGERNKVPVIIPIVGMGGMGKTTLANLVYNDVVVESHFDKRIWVCVSDPFEEIKIARAIIEGLEKGNTSKDSNELQTLMQCIFELSKGKKFLLVLDDVWNPKSRQWEELIKSLQNGAMGSRVLVTTRKEEVVIMMKATTQMIPLKELGEPFCLSLFYDSADVDESSLSTEFLDIGMEIVKKCKGLPLAAKTLGSLMRNKKRIQEWRAVLENKLWELKEIEHDVFQPLILSFHDLDPAIRRCLLYCVLCPKDYIYSKNILIKWWMSQDYLNINESREIELTGQSYFDELVRRSFFQDVERDQENEDITCKVHDIVHDFLLYLTKNESLILDFDLDGGERTNVSNDKVRHLTLVHATESDFLASLNLSCKKLRSFLTIGDFPRYSSADFLNQIFELILESKSLRTLTLCPELYFKSIPETIGKLIHLRYLDLSGNSALEELPHAIDRLYNLQTLRLVGCVRLRNMNVGRLINLKHLHIRKCDDLLYIQGIEKLTHLQTLDSWCVGGGCDGAEGIKLEDLKDLNQLQGSLVVKIMDSVNVAENAAIMVNKAHLLRLSIEFPIVYEEHAILPRKIPEREILNALEPHPSLEYLSVFYYKGSAFSHWLSSLHNLRELLLDNCPECETLPPLGKLASLELLEISKLHKVSKVGVEFLGIPQGQNSSSSSVFISFPNLKLLRIQFMGNWQEWEGVEEDNSENTIIMPCLSHLEIYACGKLKALPDFLWNTPLENLIILCSPILEDLYRQGTGEDWHKISHIPTIQIDDE